MGHVSHVGFVTTQAFGQAVLFRVDQPEVKGEEEVLKRPEWVGDDYCAPGSIVKRQDIPAATVLIGAGSVYRIIPCDEAAAMKAIRSSESRPLILVKLVEPDAAVAKISAGSGFGRDYEEDEYIPR
jgi:hypothetical protein